MGYILFLSPQEAQLTDSGGFSIEHVKKLYKEVHCAILTSNNLYVEPARQSHAFEEIQQRD